MMDVQTHCTIYAMQDSVAKWLRRWIANPLLFERVNSNLTTVDIILLIPILSHGCMRCVTILYSLHSR